MKRKNNLLKFFLLLGLFSLKANAETPAKVNAKTGATTKIDAVSTPTVSQVDKWKTLINLDDYVCNNKKQEKINYTPNYYKYIDKSSKEIVINGRVYDYDASSGASRTAADMVNHSQTLKYDGKKGAAKELEADPKVKEAMEIAKKKNKEGQEKIKAMYWSVQPPKGIIVGDYYSGKKVFDGGYEAYAEVVVNNNEIVHIELNERPPITYYASEWAGETKRRSGYGFFQAKNARTNYTLVTLINGMSYLEWQVLKNQKLDLDYKTLFGSSNSAKNGFVPLLKEMAKEVKEKASDKRYVGITQPYDCGISTRLEVIYEKGKIVDLKYDEIFADDKENIKNPVLREFYRQSKLESIEYNRITNKSFRTFVNTLRREVLRSQSLTEFPSDALKLDMPHVKEAYKNYLFLAEKIKNIK
ncbi:hypothetical protein [Treponema lecithinolyticum]|uniref:Uncharacterized protein n=1 Tax=Treponema lecithinolyticum ATCC 700332 TaxID=1321815 RepID=A0ABN0P1S4_TRELE|nr:hypothetical protein [Treponema lecithinolyticum]ERJ94395.1 hypothetical protein HMPREF9193_00367 [Treponema lecithinolyticum ATCC 700332]